MANLNLRNRHFLVIDTLVLLVTPVMALTLRLEKFDFSSTFLPGLIGYTLLGLLVRTLSFYRFGLYRRYWRYASVDELLQISLAVLTSTLVLTLAFVVARAVTFFVFPRSILIIDALLVLLAVGGSRFSVRFGARHSRSAMAQDSRRVLIAGAGDAGMMVVRELEKNAHLGLRPIGFVDDDPHKLKMRILGLHVLGSRQDISRVIAAHAVDEVVIAMPTAPGKVIRDIVGQCEGLGVATKTIPAISELLDGTIHVNQLRAVDIEDLLRREVVQTDIAAVRRLIAGRRVLVTGGGGSIGSELCRQLLRLAPAELQILDHSENPVFEIVHELRRTGIQGPVVRSIIADIRSPDRMRNVFARHRPQVVFHAAAHKHVTLMEENPAEAVTNNIVGTQNTLAAALVHDVEHFVLISTDKAVNPSSVMGVSKRVAEFLVHQAAVRSGRPYVAVRFGNVLGSRGSVVLTFRQQIATGGPVTVTHPEMTRYFMTIPEAVQLVLQAAVLGRGKEVFVLDMGQPVKIVDLARDMIELSGLELGRDIDIEFIGRLPGEKLFEELFVSGETYERTHHEKIFIAANASRFVPEELDQAISALEISAQRQDDAAILAGLKDLVPEYVSADSDMPSPEKRTTREPVRLPPGVSPNPAHAS